MANCVGGIRWSGMPPTIKWYDTDRTGGLSHSIIMSPLEWFHIETNCGADAFRHLSASRAINRLSLRRNKGAYHKRENAAISDAKTLKFSINRHPGHTANQELCKIVLLFAGIAFTWLPRSTVDGPSCWRVDSGERTAAFGLSRANA